MKKLLVTLTLTLLAACGEAKGSFCESLDNRLEAVGEMLQLAEKRSDSASNAVESLRARGEYVSTELRAEFFASMANLQSAMAEYRQVGLDTIQQKWDSGCFE